jgi:hypothetical protein
MRRRAAAPGRAQRDMDLARGQPPACVQYEREISSRVSGPHEPRRSCSKQQNARHRRRMLQTMTERKTVALSEMHRSAGRSSDQPNGSSGPDGRYLGEPAGARVKTKHFAETRLGYVGGSQEMENSGCTLRFGTTSQGQI